jgi:magnesium transporter
MVRISGGIMPRLYRKKSNLGLPPGSLVQVGAPDTFQTRIRAIQYHREFFAENTVSKVEEILSLQGKNETLWINIDGRDIKTIETIDDHYGVHPLVLEDIVSTGQRPKVDDYGDYLFIVLKMIYFDDTVNDIYAEQIGLVLSSNHVISFQEKPGDLFDPIRERLRAAKGRVRQSGADYLMYCLIDAIVDHYFVLLETIGGQVDLLEQRLMENNDGQIATKIHFLKRQIIFLRGQIWPLRDVVGSLIRLENPLINPETKVYLRDVYDHCTQVNDTIESFRDALSGLHDIYLSMAGYRMNEIMKVLTIFAAIFIPLTFIAGIYGMNFDHMPELRWRYGYFGVLAFMGLLAAGMLYVFKIKRWF